jgi:two-component system, NarL family, sensor histidine kinase UhpB
MLHPMDCCAAAGQCFAVGADKLSCRDISGRGARLMGPWRSGPGRSGDVVGSGAVGRERVPGLARPQRIGHHSHVGKNPFAMLYAIPLFWRVSVINAVVFLAGILTLALSPATVSSPLLPTEVVVLALGLVAVLVMNALLLRVGLAPLERLARMMETIDLLRPGQRVPESGGRELRPLVRTFNQMLERLEAERAASNARALSAQESERRRIARELHDEIGQSLTAVLLTLKRVEEQAPGELVPDLLDAQDAARSSLDDARRIAQRLRPDVLEELGLLAALTALVNEFADVTGLVVRSRFDPSLPRLPEATEVVIYRVVQESLTNVARHADADAVEVALLNNSGPALCVRDDGRGLQGPEGSGIRGMRERALLVRADLDVQTRPDGGTEVRLQLPRGDTRGGGVKDDNDAHPPG